MRTTTKAALFLSCSLALAACGDDDSDTDSVIDLGRADAGGDAATDPSDMGDDRDMGAADEPTPAEIAAAGVVFASCVPDDGPVSFIEGFYFGGVGSNDALTADPAMIRCLASTGGGCDALDTCAGISVGSDGPCAPSCDGDVFTACDDALRVSVDCGRYGATCDVDEGCRTEPVGPTCDFDTFEDSCDDGRPTFCSGNVTQGAVCADLGLTCTTTEGQFPGATCIGGEGACTSSGQTPWGYELEPGTCTDGDRLQLCANGGLHTVSCSDLHSSLSCQTTADGSFCARAAECDTWCDPASADCDTDPFAGREVTCEGTEVVLCDMGEVVRIDCTTLGFTGCSPFGCTE